VGYIGKVPADVLIDPMVDSAAITDATIVTADLANDAVTSAKLAADSVDSSELINGSVDNAHLAGSIAMNKTNLTAGTGLTLSTDTLNVDAAQTQITSVGTIGTGVWNGTVVASAYLDADTAHLTTTQTFTGAKTFSDNTVIQGDNKYLDVKSADYSNVYIGSAGSSGAGLDRGIIVLRENGSNKTLLYGDGSADFGAKVFINQDATNAYAFEIDHEGDAWNGLHVDASALTTGSAGHFYSDANRTADYPLVELQDDNASSSGYGLKIRCDGDGDFIRGMAQGNNTKWKVTNTGAMEISGSNYDQLKITGSGSESGIKFIDSGGQTDGFIYASGETIGFLAANGSWNLQTSSSSATFAGRLNVGGGNQNDFTPTLGVTGAQPGLVLDDSATEAFLVAYCDGDASVMMYDHNDSFIIKQAESTGGSSAADVLLLNSSKNAEFAGTLQATTITSFNSSDGIISKRNDGTDTRMQILNTHTGSCYLYFDASNGDLSGSDYAFIKHDNSNLDLIIQTEDSSGKIQLNSKESSTMTLDGWKVGIGEAGPSTVCHIKGQNDAHAGLGVLLLQTAYAAGTTRVIQTFYDDGGTHCGEISIHRTNHTAAYGTASDYRLKENEIAISDGLTRLNQLKPYKFNFKSNPEKTKLDGFFAHEVSSIVPEAVVGEKDAMAVNPVTGEEGISKQQIDQSKLVPLLVAAVQELSAKVKVLESA
jgi:hypothetical protein